MTGSFCSVSKIQSAGSRVTTAFKKLQAISQVDYKPQALGAASPNPPDTPAARTYNRKA